MPFKKLQRLMKCDLLCMNKYDPKLIKYQAIPSIKLFPLCQYFDILSPTKPIEG